jgi:uncharacterized lipoprotein YmbA
VQQDSQERLVQVQRVQLAPRERRAQLVQQDSQERLVQAQQELPVQTAQQVRQDQHPLEIQVTLCI